MVASPADTYVHTNSLYLWKNFNSTTLLMPKGDDHHKKVLKSFLDFNMKYAPTQGYPKLIDAQEWKTIFDNEITIINTKLNAAQQNYQTWKTALTINLILIPAIILFLLPTAPIAALGSVLFLELTAIFCTEKSTRARNLAAVYTGLKELLESNQIDLQKLEGFITWAKDHNVSNVPNIHTFRQFCDWFNLDLLTKLDRLNIQHHELLNKEEKIKWA